MNEVDVIPRSAQRFIPDATRTPPEGLRMISAGDHLLDIDHLFEERLDGNAARRYGF